jgi:hypothetical protein
MGLASSVSGFVRVRAKLIASEEFFVDRRLFLPFVLAGKTWKGDFKTTFAEKNWILRQGSRRAEFAIRTDKVGGYGKWTDHSGLKELRLSEDLRKMLLASFSCATADPSMPQLNCVYLGGRLVMATNQTVMFVGIGQKIDGMRFPFPVEVIPLLGDGLVNGVGVAGNQVILDCGCGYLEGSVSALAQKHFPKLQIVNQIQGARKWPLLVRLPAERLAKMMGRLAEYLAGIRREDWMLRMELGDGKLRATVKVAQGKFEERMEVEEAKKEGVVEWPLELIRPVLEYMGQTSESVKVRMDEDKKTPYLISGGGVELMVARRKA